MAPRGPGDIKRGLWGGKTLLVTEEDYIDTDEVPPGGCRGQGEFETWDLLGAEARLRSRRGAPGRPS